MLPASDRAELVAALRGVDYVVVFGDPTVERLLLLLTARRALQRHGLHRRLGARARGRGRATAKKTAAGVEAVYVGYKSNPQAIPDVQSGLLTFMMIDTVNAKLAIDRGALKGLLVTDTTRYPPLPDVPTAAEAGLARCPADDLDRALRAQGHAARDRREDQCRHPRRGRQARRARPARSRWARAPKLMSPDEFAAFTRSEKERWGKIIHRANIKVE